MELGVAPMANPRQAEREANETTKETAQKIAEETGQAAHTAADAGARAARTGGEILPRSAGRPQRVVDSGSKMMGGLVEQAMQRVARAFGVAGNARQATQQSARNTEAIVQSGTIIAGGMQNISRELVEFA